MVETTNMSLNNPHDGAFFLLYSVIEAIEILKNSSIQISYDSQVVVDGIYANCSTNIFSQDVVDYTFVALSLLFLIVYSFFIKRISFKKHWCSGRPGLILPMSMIDKHENMLLFTLAFLLVSEMIYTFTFGLNSNIGNEIPIVKFIIKLFVVVALSLTSYVIFAGLQNEYLIGYIFGAIISGCYSYRNISIALKSGNCLFKTKLIPFLLTAGISCSIDVSLLIIFLFKIIIHFRSCDSKPSESSDHEFCSNYVKTLFMEKEIQFENNEEMTKEAKSCLETKIFKNLKHIIRQKVYKEIPGFKLPPRLIIGISVGSYFAFRIMLDYIYSMTPSIWIFNKALDLEYSTTFTNISSAFKVITSDSSLYTDKEVKNSYRFLTFFYIQLFICCAIIAIFLGFLNSLINSFLIIRNYRLNFNKITKKGFSSIMKLEKASPPYRLILGFIQFSGYQAAHILWGIIVVFIMSIILLYFVIGIFILPLIYVENSFSRRFLQNFGPVIIASILLDLIQTLIVKYIFVKEKGNIMEIDNRRGFIIFCHCLFFLNAMMGIFTSIKRVIIWAFSGIICFGRIDFSFLPDYLQASDSAYMCYIGFLYTEHYHHNPILRYFVHSLVELQNPLEMRSNDQLEIVSERRNNIQNSIPYSKSCKYRNKWRVAYTLINNQTLLSKRKCL